MPKKQSKTLPPPLSGAELVALEARADVYVRKYLAAADKEPESMFAPPPGARDLWMAQQILEVVVLIRRAQNP